MLSELHVGAGCAQRRRRRQRAKRKLLQYGYYIRWQLEIYPIYYYDSPGKFILYMGG